MGSDYRKQAEELVNAIIDSFNNGQGTAPSLIAIENALRQVADDARKEEREACAKVCAAQAKKYYAIGRRKADTCQHDSALRADLQAVAAENCKKAIRNRSTQENKNAT